MFSSNVQPRRRVKPDPSPWRCRCWPTYTGTGLVPKPQPSYLARCPDCGTKRPELPTAPSVPHVFVTKGLGYGATTRWPEGDDA